MMAVKMTDEVGGAEAEVGGYFLHLAASIAQ
jgi:hypothetical protein